ncbi:MAG: hypothetical protein ACAH06_12190 [Methylophilaceae bacterium]
MWKSFVNLAVCGVLLWGAANARAEETSMPNSTNTAMEWQMMPGESLNSLAALFYPKNRRMQQLFVTSAIKLNREQMPELSPTQRFEEKTTLQIPSLIDLSRKAAKQRKHKAAAHKPAVHKSTAIEKPIDIENAPPTAAAPMSKAQDAEINLLEKRVEKRQAELEKLNQRLKALEQNTQAMQESIKANSKPLEEAQGRRLKRVEP